MATIKHAAAELRKHISDYQIYILFEDLLGITKNDFITEPDKDLTDEEISLLSEAADRLKLHEPIQYITGKAYFMGEMYKVGPGVLIPRDDTEVLVNVCDRLIKEKKYRNCIDLCSGTGIIAITLKKLNSGIDMTAVEIDDVAFSYLRENKTELKSDILIKKADIFDYVNEIKDDSIDLLISNPPYISESDMKTLQKEVTFEPYLALFGGSDGLDFYRKIIDLYSKKVKKGGSVAFQIGEEQKDKIYHMLDKDFDDIHIYNDIQNLPRAISAKKR